VYDPFSGTGTTGVVANRLGREFIGSEINKELVDISKKRIKDD
jgi:DNA modification methylase